MQLLKLPANQSPFDRSVRFFLGLSLAVVTAPGMPILEGVHLKYLLFVFALANLFASATGWCAGYAMFGFSTCKARNTPTEITLAQAEQFSAGQLEQDFNKFRTAAVIGVSLLLAITASAFVFHEFKAASTWGLQRDLVSLVEFTRSLSVEVADAQSEGRWQPIDTGAGRQNLQQAIRSLDPAGEFFVGVDAAGAAPVFLQTFESVPARSVALAFEQSQPMESTGPGLLRDGSPILQQVRAFGDVGSNFIGVQLHASGLPDAGLTIIKSTTARDEEVLGALKRAGIIVLIYVWTVGWLTYVLIRSVGDRVRNSNELMKLSFDRIAHHRQELEQVVAERTHEAEVAKTEAIGASQAKSAFLANMSHEIRTPLNAVIGMTHLALQSELTPKVRKQLRTASTSAGMLLGIINDILDFSKIEAGKLTIEPHEFSVEEMSSSVLDVLALKAEEKGIELMFDFDPALPTTVIGDRLRLSQILSNLGSNAIKFTEAGGEVVIRLGADTVTSHIIRLHGEVRDTGIGISAEQQQSLFQDFSQADISTTRKFGGTGLGLAICKSLTAMMNGRIWVESKEGVGSSFHFVVELGVAQDQIYPASEAIKYRRVLIVDDSANSRHILENQLSAYPTLRVDSVAKGTAAIKTLRYADKTDPYDLVFMDWRMPDLDGIETIQLIQGDSRIENTPDIILISAYGRLEQHEIDEDVHLKGMLCKPILPSDLVRALETEGSLASADLDPESEVDVVEDDCERKLRGARILLAEDNELNQELMKEILEDYEVSLTIVDNGWEAIEALENQTFDGVLMDGQMPVMDGYTATQAIRQQERFKDLPIIALTANAMEHDRLHSLEAGMNDHISKPVDIEVMLETMCRWIKPASGSGDNGTDEGLSAVEMRSRLSAVEGINLDAALVRLAGKIEVYWGTLQKFADRHGEFAEEFLERYRFADYEEARQMAHNLRGTAANLAMKSIAERAADLEALCSEHASEELVLPALDALASELTRLIEQVGDLES